ncbi:WAPL family protein [Aspergillus undulatus]|uniref:WAPL family protein n=1 Tax=Aspergillus undulatus TaxID=1810928 RepID=UPI003CCD48E0
MPQNRKRPVTYGKSPLTRIEAHAPGSRVLTSPSSVDKSMRAACSSPKSSARPLQPFRLPKTLPGPPSSQEEDERSSMQRKRRKVSHGIASRDHTPTQMNPHAFELDSSEAGAGDNKAVLPRIFHHASDQERNHSHRSPCSDNSSETRLANQPSSRLREDPASASRKDDLLSTRRRLIDSLGTTDGIDVRTPASDDMIESAHISNRTIIDRLHSTSAHRHYTRDQSESGTRTHGRLRRDSCAPIPSMLRSSGVTYSRQRSFLNESLSVTGCEPHGLGKPLGLGTEKAPDTAAPSHMPSEEEDLHEIKPVRSIHELRQAGDNARFREVIDSMFEDLENPDSSRSGRCCGLAELCGKLMNPQFAHRFSEQGFDERLVDCTSSSLDITSAFLALAAYKLILSGGHASRPFFESSWPRILELAPLLLDIEDDLLVLAREPSMALSKTAQASIRAIRAHLPTAICSTSACLSPRLMALECMKSSLIVLRESGHTIRLVPMSLLKKLVNMMTMIASSDLYGSQSESQFQLLDLEFAVFENYSVISESFNNDHIQCFRRLSRLHSLLTLGRRDSQRHISLSYIRMILNLTNKEPTLCESFAIPALVSEIAKVAIRESCELSRDMRGDESSTLDGVVLALGTLINLTENAERSRAILMQSSSHTVSFFDQLLQQFSVRVPCIDQAHSMPEVHDNVVAGYLSILLLTVCLDKQARLAVKGSLAGDGLAPILSTAEKFLQYHRKIEKDTQPSEPWEQGESRLTARLEHIISRIRLLEELARAP